MKYFLKICSVLLVLTLLAGCVGSSPDSTGNTDGPSTDDPDELAIYDLLFAAGSKVQLNLRMEDSEIAKMQADYNEYSARGSKSPIYRMADLDVTITASDGKVYTYTIDQVGVRMKGNTSRTDFYNDTDGIYNQIHLKISFQETFDKEKYYGDDALEWQDEAARDQRKDRTFATLEKIDLRWNKSNDVTYIREHYAFEMYRDNGVLAPNTTLASLDWAGQHMGVYTLYEPVDKVFLKRNLPKELTGGDLYKCGWTNHGSDLLPTDSIGVEDEYEGLFFTYDLKTNKKTSSHEKLNELINYLNGDSVTKEGLAEYVDMDNFLTFAALSYFLGNPDDYRNNYNNFYLYFPENGGCLFIPTDCDRCMGVTFDWDPTGNGVTTDDPFSTVTALGSEQHNPLLLNTICYGGKYLEEYTQKLTQVANSKWVTEEHYRSMFRVYQQVYADLTAPGKLFWNSGSHNTTMSMDGGDGNWTIGDYFAAKLDTFRNGAKEDDGPDDIPIESDPSTRFYIRAEYTDWAIQDAYIMEKNEDGTYTFIVPGGAMKVFGYDSQRWYGEECLPSDNAVAYETDENGNIILAEGSYRVTFDPQNLIITLEQKG